MTTFCSYIKKLIFKHKISKKTDFNKELCSICATGKYTKKIDESSPMCPYLIYCTGEKCSMFKSMDVQETKTNI